MSTPTPLLNDASLPGNSFVLPEHKMVYISVTKVACTSLRWMVADLAGEDFSTFYRASAAHQTRLMTIHTDRSSWEHSPQLRSLSEEERAAISRDLGWLVFAVVRDPWTRLWSGWQSKFLVRSAHYLRTFGDRPWFPRVPESPDHVIEDWRAFVHARPWVNDPELKRNWHFRPQVESVRPQSVNYSRIYDLRDLRDLVQDVHTHLAACGKDRELYLPRANENPLRITEDALSGGIADEIKDAYRADFEAFGSRWDVAQLRYAPDGWSPDAIDHVQYHTVANERIGDLSAEIRRLKRQLDGAEKRVVALEQQTSDPEGSGRLLRATRLRRR